MENSLGVYLAAERLDAELRSWKTVRAQARETAVLHGAGTGAALIVAYGARVAEAAADLRDEIRTLRPSEVRPADLALLLRGVEVALAAQEAGAHRTPPGVLALA
jgi:hypothetical protein